MTLSRLFLLISLLLFGTIGVLAFAKNKKKNTTDSLPTEKVCAESKPLVQQKNSGRGEIQERVDFSLLQTNHVPAPVSPSRSMGNAELGVDTASDQKEVKRHGEEALREVAAVVIEHDDEPEAMSQLFIKGSDCPIIETVRYSSRVEWKPRKQAWLVDYATHYRTPLDFIVRSIAGRPGVEAPPVKEGQQFTVLRSNVSFYFHAVISFASMKLRLYYVLPKENKAVFLKSYPVCLGRKDSSKASGSLTPFGVYLLGSRVACFKPKMMGTHKGHRVELMQVFGTRWIPFEKEISGCTEPARGFGVHGAPFIRSEGEGSLSEDPSSIGTWASDGCIRLKKEDVEELFSVISTRSTYVEILPDFQESSLLKGQLLPVQ